MKTSKSEVPPSGSLTAPRGDRPIPLGYVRAMPELNPPMTRWQAVAVVLFLLSFPFVLALLWLMMMWK